MCEAEKAGDARPAIVSGARLRTAGSRGPVLALLGLLAVAALSAACGGDGEAADETDPQDGGLTVHLLPADDEGPYPFTESVAAVDMETSRGYAADADEETAAAGTSDTAPPEGDLLALAASSGADPGIYGGSRVPVCDRDALVGLLISDDQLAGSWASAAGIEPDEIEEFVTSLAPAVLSQDVAVTSHGSEGESPVTFTAVMEGGTPVLVNDLGVPQVDCTCGNPLGQFEVGGGEEIHLEGEAWAGFDPSRVGVLEPSDESLEELVLVDIDSGEEFTEPVGGVLLDGYLVYGPHGIQVAHSSLETTDVLDDPVGVAVDDGRGGVVFNLATPEEEDRDSAQASIWHLPAGSPEPVALLGTDNPGQERFDVLEVADLGGRTLVVYEHKRRLPPPGGYEGDLYVYDLDTGEETLVKADTSGWELGIRSVSSDGEILQWLGSRAAEEWTEAVNADLEQIAPPWDPHEDGMIDCGPTGDLCPGSMALISGSEVVTRASRGGSSVVRRVASDDFDDVVWQAEHETSGDGRIRLTANRDVVVSSSELRDSSGAVVSTVFDLDTGEVLERLELQGAVVAMSAPIRRPAGGSESVDRSTASEEAEGPPEEEQPDPEPESAHGLHLDGLSLEGVAPLQFGDSLDHAVEITGLEPQLICGFDSLDQGAMLEVGTDLWLWFSPDTFPSYNVSGPAFTTGQGVGFGATAQKAQEEFPELWRHETGELLLGDIPAVMSMTVSSDDVISLMRVASRPSIEPGAGYC